MQIQVVAEQGFRVGTSNVIRGPAPEGPYLAVLEDDGTTGYFYALDTSRPQPFQDGCLIWDIASIEDKPYTAAIAWSMDSQKVLLTINGYPNAIFDFEKKEGCCRSGYPNQLGPGWSPLGHGWRDEMMQHFMGPPAPTQWEPMIEVIEALCGTDTTIENDPQAMVIETSPASFLESPQKIEGLFACLKEQLPPGAEVNFYDDGPRLVIMTSTSKFVRDVIVAQRGYVARAV